MLTSPRKLGKDLRTASVTAFEDYRVREVLSRVAWPEGLKVDYSYSHGCVIIVLYKNNFKWLDTQTVLKTQQLIPEVIMQIRTLGYGCFVEARND
jgi:hypothetical protein